MPRTSLTLVILGLLCSPARADELERTGLFHASLGWEGAGRSSSTGTSYSLDAARLHVGYHVVRDDQRTTYPMLSLGITSGLGTYTLDEPFRPVVEAGYFDIGPELQLSLVFGGGRYARNRIFASVAVVGTVTAVHTPVDYDPGLGTTGARATAGFNWSRTWISQFVDTDDNYHQLPNYWVLLLPMQLEVGYFRTERRNGAVVSLGWGI